MLKPLGLSALIKYKSKSVAQVALLLNALSDRIDIETTPELRTFLEQFSLVEQESDRILPRNLTATLRPYQHDAVAWLSSLHRSGLGGLLGDEMGLGKTLMILTHLARLKEQGFLKKPALCMLHQRNRRMERRGSYSYSKFTRYEMAWSRTSAAQLRY